MGQEQKTLETDQFRELETEMNMRAEGLEKLHAASSYYFKQLSKKKEGDDKEKYLVVHQVGNAMVAHGEEFANDSAFGHALLRFGVAQQKIARMQEVYANKGMDIWIECLEKSMQQMKQYQGARKKLETRRLNYDTTLTKVQRAKKEDFRLDEELRSQRVKYEESSDDVTRRMNEIQDSEEGTLTDLTAFLEAEFEYYDKCRDIMIQLRRQWPTEITEGGRNRHSAVKPEEAQEHSFTPSSRKISSKKSVQSNGHSNSSASHDGNSPARSFQVNQNSRLRSTTVNSDSSGSDIMKEYGVNVTPRPGLGRIMTEPAMPKLPTRPISVKPNGSSSDIFSDPVEQISPASSTGRGPAPPAPQKKKAPPIPPKSRQM